MNIKSMSLGALGTNCYIVYKEENAIIIDPGAEPEKIIEFLHSNNLSPQAILLTHAHHDHVGAVDELRTRFKMDVYLHKNEAEWLGDPQINRSVLTDRPDFTLEPGNMQLSNFSFEVVHTPGHSPGSVVFIFHDQECVFGGDVLFRQGVGRTDLHEGSLEQLKDSIRNRLYKLPESYTVYPGHGIKTSIGFEKTNNPYIPK